MKIVAQRADEYLLVPDEAEPGDNVDAVITDGESVDTKNVGAALSRGYWEEPEDDVTADDVLPESFDTETGGDDPDDPSESGEGDDDATTKSASERVADGEVVEWL